MKMGRKWLLGMFIWLNVIRSITTVSVQTNNLLGCGMITRPSRTFPYSPANYDFNANTPSTCVLACSAAGFFYASVSASQLCFCGPSSANIGLLNSTTTSCETAVCAGDSNLYCGSIDYELVYTSIGYIDSVSIFISGGISPMTLQVNQNYQFMVGYRGIVNIINYMIDFGDDTKTSWFNGTLNASIMVSHTFAKAGLFSVTVASLSYADMQPVMSAITVKVSDQISSLDLSMTCPNITTTFLMTSCNLTSLRGTDLTVAFNYNASISPRTIRNVPDAQYYTYGSSSVTNNPMIDVSGNLLNINDIVILPKSTIATAGRIASIQFYSSGNGTITVYLLRRRCVSPATYCYDTNTCGNCINPHSLQCASTTYSTISHSCVNANLTQRFQETIYSNVQFEIVAQWVVTTIGTNYQQIVANATLNMMNQTAMVGDILAFKGLSIAKEMSFDGTEDYRCITPLIAANIFTCSIGNLSSNGTKYHYLLQMTIIQAIEISPITIYNNEGTYNIEGGITQRNLTTYSAATSLLVVTGIDWIEIIVPSVLGIGTNSTLMVNVHPANASVTVYLWFINGNNTFNSTTNIVNISFATFGTYSFGCQAQSLRSMRYNSTSVVIENMISNFTLHAGNIANISTSQPFETAKFQLRMSTGNNYICRVNYDASQSSSPDFIYLYIYGYIPGSYFTHRYLEPGAYNVYAQCKNLVSNVSYSFIHYVQYPIVGLELQEHGVAKGNSFRLNFTIIQGTLPQFRIIVNGTQVNYTYDEEYNLIQTDDFPAQSSLLNYIIEVYAWNYLSSVYINDIFSVTSPINNPRIRSSTTNTAFPGPILFEYTMQSGSNMEVSFYFSDTLINTPVICEYDGDYPANLWSSCAYTNHTFQIPGTLIIVAVFSNAMGITYQHLTVTLTTSVNPIQIGTHLQTSSDDQCVAAFIDDHAVASFVIQSVDFVSKPASNAQVIITPDFVNQPTLKNGPFELTFDYFASPVISSSGLNIIYTSTGNYTALFEVSNSFDSTNISCIVQVKPILQQVYYAISPLNWPLNDTNPFQASVYVGDTNPGAITITWDFGDGTIISRTRTATRYDQAETYSHRYTSVGTYTLQISTQSPFNTITNNFTIDVQYAVSKFVVNFSGIASSPNQILYTGFPTTIPINVYDSSIPSASNPRLIIDYNDTNLLATNSVIDVSLPYNGSYTYLAAGVYLVNFTVYNHVSSITQTIKIAINAPFNNYAFTVCYLQPTLSYSSISDTCSLTLTNGYYYIPKQSQLIIYVTWTNPSAVAELFSVIFKNSSDIVFIQFLTINQVTNVSQIVGIDTSLPLFRLVIDIENNTLLLDDLYTVEVRASNPSYTATSSSRISIVSLIHGLSINDNGILVPMNVQKSFLAVYRNFSSLSCLYIHYSDDINQCYGDSTVCQSLPVDLSSTLSICPLPIQPFVYQNSAVLFARTFNVSSAWLDAYAWDYMSTTRSLRSFFSFPLSTNDCHLPIIEFDLYNPVIRWARRVQRSQSFSISTKVSLDCSMSLENIKHWSILQCNTLTEMCYSTTFLNQLVSQLSSAKTSEIYIASKLLPIGIYLFNLTVTMKSQPTVLTSNYTYIQIVPSDIQVNLLMNGTSIITRGVRQYLIFWPGVYSIDPDSDYFNPQSWTFNYYCRLYEQASYPYFNGEELTIDSTNMDPLNPSCFDSSGNNSRFQYGFYNDRSILYIQSRSLKADRSYEFKAVLSNIYDTTVTYSGYAIVHIQEADSITIVVECIIKMCKPDVEYQRINPTTQAVLTSYCIENIDEMTDTVIYWNVYRGFQTGYPNADIKWILLANMSIYENSLFYGRHTMNLTVTSQLFLNNPTVQYWKFESVYIVTTDYGIMSGTAAIRFFINSPPQNGTCSIDPINGTTMTPFYIICSDWFDTDGIDSYRFYVFESSSRTRILVGFTKLNSIELYLPIDDENYNYELSLTAEICDIYGAVASFNFPNITVTPDNASLANFIQSFQQPSLQSNTNDTIQMILYGGDQNMVNQLVLSLSKALNLMSSAAQHNAVSRSVPAQNLYVAGLFESSLNNIIANVSTNMSQTFDSYSTALNAQANIRDRVIRFVGNLSITDIDSIKLQASTLSYLTDATSTLTRQAIASAAMKSNDLIDSLNNMVDSISYEDAQMAVQSITKLASNILVAVNTPLIGRGVVIDLDYDRANALPYDYETDIETIWANPNIFAEGSDFSLETIKKNRNLYYQQLDSNQIIKQTQDILLKTRNILNYHMNVGQTNIVSTDSISMITEKTSIDQLNSFNIMHTSGTEIILPESFNCSLLFNDQPCSNSTAITVHSVLLPVAAAGINGRTGAFINMSRSVSVDLFDSLGTTIPVQNLTTPIEIKIPRDANLQLPPMKLQNVTGQTMLRSVNVSINRQFLIYYINITSTTPELSLSVDFEFKSEDLSLGYMVIHRFDGIPLLNSTTNRIDGYKIFCPDAQILTTSDGYLYSYFLDNNQTNQHEYVIFGIRELNATENGIYCPTNMHNLSSSTPPVTDAIANFTSNYYIRSYTSACYYLDENSKWQTNGIIVGPKTSHNQTHCLSYHLTTFAGGWIVLPEPVNWNYVFANTDFSTNKTIYLTVIIIAILFIIFMIYARYKDRKDIEKLGVTPLADNLMNDKYYYQLIVFTGLRKDAGTTSRVHFVLSGDDDETGVRTLEDSRREILQRGSIDSFIMAVPKSLGRLNYIRIWHDNSGLGNRASWYLKYIIVRDLQTMEKSHFICQRWLAVEKDDGVINRVIPIASEAQKAEFAYLLSKTTYYSLSDGHLWFSVFLRPPSTRFTRVQRCTCCFVLLFMSMFMNIMYYQQNQEAKTKTAAAINIGLLFITFEQITIGIIVELICFLPSTILVELFRRLRPRRRRISPVREALQRIQNEYETQRRQVALTDVHPQFIESIVSSSQIRSMNELQSVRTTFESPMSSRQALHKIDKKEFKLQNITFPWWFIYIGYGFSFIIIGTSVLFIIARGIELGDLRTRQWLTSSITGFFSSVLLTQPIKVIALALFFMLVFRRNDDSEMHDESDDMFLNGDEEYLHAFNDSSLLTCRPKSGHIPLTESEIAYARDKRLNEMKMWEIIRELLAYLSFLWVLYFVSYSNRDQNAYFLMEHLKNDFLNIDNATTDFTKIYCADQYWYWLSNSFVQHIRATDWYNGVPPTNLNGYISDKTNRILGWATMRQLRVTLNPCRTTLSLTNETLQCKIEYNMLHEEKDSFYPGWTSIDNSTAGGPVNYSSAIRRAFMYSKSSSLDTYLYVGEHATYGGGGYVYEFRGKMNEMLTNISLLKQLSWIDMQTRAVIIQLSLYNPNVNLFAFVTILAEFLPTGGIYPSARIEPILLLDDFQGIALFKLICAIIYMLFILYYMQHEISSIISRRMKYFYDLWSYIEIGIIACSWTGLAVYIWRIHEGNRIGGLFKQTNGYTYINLQMAAYVNDLLTFLLGFCCFFGSVKFLHLLRFNKRTSLLSSTLAYAANDLLSFTVMFSVIFLGFLGLFFLLFHPKILKCSNPLQTAQMLFEITLLKFDVSDLFAADAFLGPFCFTLFIIFVVFISMNMFISIIADSFRVVSSNAALQNSEHEIISFIINEFKKWTGIGTTKEVDRLHLNPFDGSQVHYHDPIASFPEKMDALITALNKVYMDIKRNNRLIFHPMHSIKPEIQKPQNTISDKNNIDANH